MSQQIMTIVSLVRLLGISILSDILVLAVKEFGNKLISLNSTSDETTTGVKLTRTIPSGKTFYLGRAKIVPADTPVSATSTDWRATAVIKFDGTIVDNIGYAGQTEQGAGEGPGMGIAGASLESNQMGISLDGDGVKKVEVDLTNLVGTNHAVRLSLIGWEEDTGTSPLADFQ